jgi:hypothetical protein
LLGRYLPRWDELQNPVTRKPRRAGALVKGSPGFASDRRPPALGWTKLLCAFRSEPASGRAIRINPVELVLELLAP